MFEVESPASLLLGLLTGIGFGFLLQKAGVAKYRTILGQFLLKDATAFKVMLSAVVVGAIGVYAMVDAGAARLDIWPFQPAAMLLGALAFGAGIAVLGYCPGTGMAGAGEGSRDAAVGVLGMIAGAGVLVVFYDALEPAALSLGDYGKLTWPDVLDVSHWPLIGALALAAAVIFWRLGRRPRELRRSGERRRAPRGTQDRRSSLPAPLPG
jgi:uncharacterized membrane protein YedE/YeeE